MLHRQAVQFTPPGAEGVLSMTARPLFREEAMFGEGLLGESGQVCPRTFFIYLFFLLFVSAGGPDKPGRGSGWQRGFCCGAAWFTIAPLWGWRLCFVFPEEITPSSALQRERERRRRIMQRRSGNKVGTVQEFKSCLHTGILLPLQLNLLPV